MSASRVKYADQVFYIKTSSWNSGELTIESSVDHNLYTNAEVSISTQQGIITSQVEVLTANTFKVTCNNISYPLSLYTVRGYLPGQTGNQEKVSIPRGNAADAVIQSYVTGTGAAEYNVELSLDGSHWNEVANVVHSSTDGDTGYLIVSPGWTYFRPNVVSVGANTTLTIMIGN